MKVTVKLVMTLTVMLAASSFALAQNQNLAVSAYEKWKENVINKQEKNIAYQYLGLGVAVSKLQNKGIEVSLAIGASSEVNKLSSLVVTVQPIKIVSENGQNMIQEVGAVSKLQSPELERGEDEIICKPQITVRFPNEANGVRIIVTGMNSDKPYTVTLPVDSEPKTAALGKFF